MSIWPAGLVFASAWLISLAFQEESDFMGHTSPAIAQHANESRLNFTHVFGWFEGVTESSLLVRPGILWSSGLLHNNELPSQDNKGVTLNSN